MIRCLASDRSGGSSDRANLHLKLAEGPLDGRWRVKHGLTDSLVGKFTVDFKRPALAGICFDPTDRFDERRRSAACQLDRYLIDRPHHRLKRCTVGHVGHFDLIDRTVIGLNQQCHNADRCIGRRWRRLRTTSGNGQADGQENDKKGDCSHDVRYGLRGRQTMRVSIIVAETAKSLESRRTRQKIRKNCRPMGPKVLATSAPVESFTATKSIGERVPVSAEFGQEIGKQSDVAIAMLADACFGRNPDATSCAGTHRRLALRRRRWWRRVAENPHNRSIRHILPYLIPKDKFLATSWTSDRFSNQFGSAAQFMSAWTSAGNSFLLLIVHLISSLRRLCDSVRSLINPTQTGKFRAKAGRDTIRCSHPDLGWMRIVQHSGAEKPQSGSPLLITLFGQTTRKSLRCYTGGRIPALHSRRAP